MGLASIAISCDPLLYYQTKTGCSNAKPQSHKLPEFRLRVVQKTQRRAGCRSDPDEMGGCGPRPLATRPRTGQTGPRRLLLTGPAMTMSQSPHQRGIGFAVTMGDPCDT